MNEFEFEFECEECGCEVTEDECGLCDNCFDAMIEECDEFDAEFDNEGTLQ